MKSNQIRATGASCKECRRLKIKCDKMVPCGTCTKRGLQSLCPDGQLSGAKGSRYVLATAEESWHRIQALCVRVQDLEFALERAHSLVAGERHPLLDEDLVKIGQDPRAVVKTEPGRSPAPPPEDVPIANFGTMKISKSGAYRWLGTTALPAMMLDDYDEEDTGHPDLVSDTLHERVPGIPAPRNLVPANELKVQALQQLPSRQRALQLIESFFECYARWSTLIARSTVIDTLFTVAYDGDPSSLSAYNLSTLYSILALGCLYDTPPDPTGQEFKEKRKWAKTLFYSDWPKGPSAIDELEALLLLYRVEWPFMEITPSENYEFMAWGIKLGEKIGLHRDPEPLNLPAEECTRRRRVFWTLWFYDSLNSLILGQPPTLTKGFVDCKSPQELNVAGTMDIHPRATLAMQDILAHFLESKASPPYAAVLQLDQKIREIDFDPHTPMKSPVSPCTPGGRQQEASSAYSRAVKAVLMLSLHRTYFSYAILRPNEDPIAGRLGTSIIAIYESATSMLESGLTVSRYTPWMHAGCGQIWMQYHTAMLVLYAFAIYMPYWSRSEDAVKSADSALTSLFYPNAREREPVANSLPSLVQAQTKAKEALAKYQKGQWTHPSSVTGQSHDEEANQELFLNNKFVITSASGYETSRDSTPSDYQAYPDSSSSSSFAAYRATWVGYDSPTVVPSEPLGQFSQGSSNILSPQQQNDSHFDEANLYKNTGMDWSHHHPSATTVPKMESPPMSAGLYPSLSHYPSQPHSLRTGTPSTLQIPGEVIGVADHRHAPIRRVRGLSRAHSFPSDHPAGYSSAGSIQTHAFQSMQAPSSIPSPTTPVGSASLMHSLEHQQQQHQHQHQQHHVHEPYGRWITSTSHSQDPYRLSSLHTNNNNGYGPNPTNVPQHNHLASPVDTGAIPLHVLEQSWSNFNVQQR